MIENYAEKKKNGLIEHDIAESGNIVILERKFDENTGIRGLRPGVETNLKHMDDLIADNERYLDKYEAIDVNLRAIREDVDRESRRIRETGR